MFFVVSTTNVETQTPAIRVQVLAVYDNLDAGKKAKELCDRIQQFLGSDYELNLHPWNTAFLRIDLFARAAMDTVEWPTLLIIAVDGNKSLPPFFKRWIDQCIRKPYPAVAVTIAQIYGVLRTKLELTSAHQELEQLASNAGAAFLSEVVELPDCNFDNGIAEVRETTSSIAKPYECRTLIEIESFKHH